MQLEQPYPLVRIAVVSKLQPCDDRVRFVCALFRRDQLRIVQTLPARGIARGPTGVVQKLFHGLGLRRSSNARNGKTDVYRGTDSFVEKITFEIDLTVSN